MDRYIVQHHSRTLAALARRNEQQTFPLPAWAFNFPAQEVKVALFDSVKKTDNINLHTGLNIITTLKAGSVEEAKETSRDFVETILNLISFSTLAFCSPAKLINIINILDTDTEAHPFRHYVYPFDEQEIFGSLSVINKSTFGAVFEAYTKSPRQQISLRVLSWLRKGIREENFADEFICYWIGLEVIKHILRRKLKRNRRNVAEWDGVKEIFTNKLHFDDFDTIKKDVRNGLLHGFRQHDNEFAREIKSYVEPIRKTLIFCIGSVLGLEENIILAIADKTPRRIRQNPWSVIEGVIKNILEDFDELVKNYPMIDAEIANKKFSISESGKLNITISVTHHFHGPSGVTWKIKAAELWGDEDAGIEHVEIKE